MHQNWSVTGIQLTVVKKMYFHIYEVIFFLVNFLTFIQHFESNKCKYECFHGNSLYGKILTKKKRQSERLD